MSETTHYVTYTVAPQQRNGMRGHFSQTEEKMGALKDSQQTAIAEFIAGHHPAEVLASFIELPDNKRAIKWPELQNALKLCQERNATLIIVELGSLTTNESFTKVLLEAEIKFHCLDQPFVNQTILEALSKHAQVQRKLHGKLIREGLKMTSAKSGNPNAAEVIGKVNKPKIDTAIVFAFLLQPIILDYRRKGYSQRQMVKTLNDEGFTAPEGGKWVLSQLQKVLDRVRLNEIATEVKPLLEKLPPGNNNLQQIADFLNSQGIISLKKTPWDEPSVKKLQERIQQIQDIVLINQFVLDVLPVLHEYRKHGLDTTQMLKDFHESGLMIRHNVPTAA